jgi:hypothetical protein
MVNSTAHPKAELYASLMQEAKTRMDGLASLVDHITKNPNEPLAFMNAELAFLQLRFVCELIGLAAVVAHEQLGLTKDLMKSFNPEKMFNLLGDINPQCFPIPVKRSHIDGAHHLEPRDRDLSPEDLGSIYARSGDVLHRGLVKHVLAGRKRAYNIAELDGWAKKIGSLLSEHMVPIPSEGVLLFVHVVNGEIQTALVASEDGQSFQLGPTWDHLAYKSPTGPQS